MPGGVGALDGTRIKAVAALAANRTAATIEQAVAAMLTEARRVDEAEARVDGTNREALPEAVQDRTSRSARRYECQKRLTPAAADATAKANVTDPESRIMQTPRGYVQDSNAPAVGRDGGADPYRGLGHVRGQRCHTIATPVDAGTGESAPPQAPPGHPDRPGRGRLLQRDPSGGGQASPADRAAQRLETAPGTAGAARPARAHVPATRHRDRMARTLLTQRGRRLYKKRGQPVGPMFGQIKDGRGGGLRHATGPPSR